jgi:glyoxylase-like metal-dependent hydrolase (beta-lactamase superfamily II)
MAELTQVMSRRTFLRDLGHGAFALTVMGVAGCVPGALTPTPANRATSQPAPTRTFDPLTYVGNLDEIRAVWCRDPVTTVQPSGWPALDHTSLRRWARIGNHQTSAYVLVRGGEATIVDTAGSCLPDAMEDGLEAAGLGWSAVGSIIVTHKHPDHWIGLSSALERAPDAAVFAGAADIPHIASSRPITAVGAGDRIMDLAIIPTPGHTPGHIAVHDEAAGVLVAGDAINYGEDAGFVLLGTSEDVEQTRASFDILAELAFETFLGGHGDPIIGGASERLREYLATA